MSDEKIATFKLECLKIAQLVCLGKDPESVLLVAKRYYNFLDITFEKEGLNPLTDLVESQWGVQTPQQV